MIRNNIIRKIIGKPLIVYNRYNLSRDEDGNWYYINMYCDIVLEDVPLFEGFYSRMRKNCVNKYISEDLLFDLIKTYDQWLTVKYKKEIINTFIKAKKQWEIDKKKQKEFEKSTKEFIRKRIKGGNYNENYR